MVFTRKDGGVQQLRKGRKDTHKCYKGVLHSAIVDRVVQPAGGRRSFRKGRTSRVRPSSQAWDPHCPQESGTTQDWYNTEECRRRETWE